MILKFKHIKWRRVYSGYVSTENNGGFSSISRSISPLTNEITGVSLDVNGDGQMYQLRLITYTDGYRLAYKAEFKSHQGQSQRLQFILADFQATYRGRKVIDAPLLTTENIDEVTLLITKKVAGPFAIQLHRLSFY